MENLADAFQGTRMLLDHEAAARASSSGAAAGQAAAGTSGGPGPGPSESLEPRALVDAMAAVLLVMDALSAYYGEDGALEEATVDRFLAAAAALDAPARSAALAAAAPRLKSSRWTAVAAGERSCGGGGPWAALSPEIKAMVQLPSSRAKRQRVR
jgi:hypothetical protein